MNLPDCMYDYRYEADRCESISLKAKILVEIEIDEGTEENNFLMATQLKQDIEVAAKESLYPCKVTLELD